VPYGIYDLAQNEGFVSVGDSHDTAEFAVETIRRWWAEVGSLAYPDANGSSSPPMQAVPTATARAFGG